MRVILITDASSIGKSVNFLLSLPSMIHCVIDTVIQNTLKIGQKYSTVP